MDGIFWYRPAALRFQSGQPRRDRAPSVINHVRRQQLCIQRTGHRIQRGHGVAAQIVQGRVTGKAFGAGAGRKMGGIAQREDDFVGAGRSWRESAKNRLGLGCGFALIIGLIRLVMRRGNGPQSVATRR